MEEVFPKGSILWGDERRIAALRSRQECQDLMDEYRDAIEYWQGELDSIRQQDAEDRRRMSAAAYRHDFACQGLMICWEPQYKRNIEDLRTAIVMIRERVRKL